MNKISADEFDQAVMKNIRLRKMVHQFDKIQTRLEKIENKTTNPDFSKLMRRALELESKMKKLAFKVVKGFNCDCVASLSNLETENEPL